MEIDVRHIAKLAMLKLSEDQVKAMEQELAAFVAMAEHLPKPERSNTPWAPGERMSLREDVVTSSCPREAILQNAPKTDAGCIVLQKSAGTSELV